MALSLENCISEVQARVGDLSSAELSLVSYLFNTSHPSAFISELILEYRWLQVKLAIESIKRKKMTPEEEDQARRMHASGKPLGAILEALFPNDSCPKPPTFPRRGQK